MLADVRRGYSDTYVHLGRKAAAMIAPDAPRHFPPKSASTMEVSMVTGSLSQSSSPNVNVNMALLLEGVSDGDIRNREVRSIVGELSE
jgi:hypothetical protein